VRQAILKKTKHNWAIGGLRGMSLEEMNSALDQILGEVNCPEKVLLLDLGEQWSHADLSNEQARLLLWNKL